MSTEREVEVKMPDKTKRKFKLVPAGQVHTGHYSCEGCFFSKDRCTLPSRNKALCLPTTNALCIGYIYIELEKQ
jgi:hypothetical protein